MEENEECGTPDTIVEEMEEIEQEINREVVRKMSLGDDEYVPDNSFMTKIETKLNNVTDKISSAKMIRNRDKVTFTFEVIRVFGSMFCLGRWPCEYVKSYVFLLYAMCFSRWIYYRFFTKQHYFFFDYCYCANLLFSMFFAFYPENVLLFNYTLIVANGPILFSVFLFKMPL
jgi:hypothetical protein